MKNNLKTYANDADSTIFIDELWSDKKRYFGMPISFTKYSLCKDRLMSDEGLIIARHNEILLYRIRDINVSVSLWQRLFSVGTVRVFASDTTTPVLSMINIKTPLVVKELLHRTVEHIKEEKGFHVGEYFDTM